MYISQIYASGFRCFAPDAPLCLSVKAGLNILVGPNDAGKSAIIDAARYVLWTRGDDYIRPDSHDFFVDASNNRVCDFVLRCTFDDLKPDEEARFLEWCTNEGGKLRLHVCMRAVLRASPGGGSTVSSQHRAGFDGEGLPLDGELREYLKATYLKPLRDAEREMRSGKRSRLSRILGAMPVMNPQAKTAVAGEAATLFDTLASADLAVKSNPAIVDVQDKVNTTFLGKLSFADDPLAATLDLGSKGSFDQILERLELYLNAKTGNERVMRGLGYNNLLFMAAELLLLQSHPDQVPFLLIEEPEAHLHPQHQTLFMEVLAARAKALTEAEKSEGLQQVQVLLTTHSPQLAAAADLETLTMIVGHRAFPLASGQTKLEPDDYEFLRRFLDATKANLFFARGLIVVEGDAENILFPAIAEKMGRPLSRHGVSIVNVGHRGLFRYSRVLQRAAEPVMAIPVALIPDRDIPPAEAKVLVGKRETENELTDEVLKKRLATLRVDEGGAVKAFVSEQWTLEFDLAQCPDLALPVHLAVQLAKTTSRNADWLKKIGDAATTEYEGWKADTTLSATDVAVSIFTPLFNNDVSKPQVAEQLAKILRDLPDSPATFSAKLPPYLVQAVEYVTGGPSSTPAGTSPASGTTAPSGADHV